MSFFDDIEDDLIQEDFLDEVYGYWNFDACQNIDNFIDFLMNISNIKLIAKIITDNKKRDPSKICKRILSRNKSPELYQNTEEYIYNPADNWYQCNSTGSGFNIAYKLIDNDYTPSIKIMIEFILSGLYNSGPLPRIAEILILLNHDTYDDIIQAVRNGMRDLLKNSVSYSAYHKYGEVHNSIEDRFKKLKREIDVYTNKSHKIYDITKEHAQYIVENNIDRTLKLKDFIHANKSYPEKYMPILILYIINYYNDTTRYKISSNIFFNYFSIFYEVNYDTYINFNANFYNQILICNDIYYYVSHVELMWNIIYWKDRKKQLKELFKYEKEII